MSSDETGQMSALRQDRCLLLRRGSALSHYFTSALSQQKTSVLSHQQTPVLSQQTTFVSSQQHIVCVSETGQGPDTWKAMDLDNRTVTFQTDRTPQDRIAVRF